MQRKRTQLQQRKKQSSRRREMHLVLRVTTSSALPLIATCKRLSEWRARKNSRPSNGSATRRSGRIVWSGKSAHAKQRSSGARMRRRSVRRRKGLRKRRIVQLKRIGKPVAQPMAVRRPALLRRLPSWTGGSSAARDHGQDRAAAAAGAAAAATPAAATPATRLVLARVPLIPPVAAAAAAGLEAAVAVAAAAIRRDLDLDPGRPGEAVGQLSARVDVARAGRAMAKPKTVVVTIAVVVRAAVADGATAGAVEAGPVAAAVEAGMPGIPSDRSISAATRMMMSSVMHLTLEQQQQSKTLMLRVGKLGTRMEQQ